MVELKIGDIIRIRFRHWPSAKPTERGIIEDKVDVHCQLHGEYQYTTWRVRKVKNNGRKSYLYELPENLEGVDIEVVGHGTG